MTQLSKLHHLGLFSALASTLALSSGCVPKIDDLDAGFDDEDDTNDSEGNVGDAAECLIGTAPDALGVERSAWVPECAVECDVGWGHDGDQLEIEWTTDVSTLPPHPPEAQPLALGMLASGRLVVASKYVDGLMLTHFEPHGLNFGGYDAVDIGSSVYGVEIDSNVVYVMHGEDDGIVVVSATSLDSQQELWRHSYPGMGGTAIARGGGKVAFVLTSDGLPLQNEVIVLDIDGNAEWTSATVDRANDIGFSPSGARLAVVGETTRVYAADDGALLDEIAHPGPIVISAKAMTFVDEDRLIIGGSLVDNERFDGWLAGASLADNDTWHHVYNRATSWCPEPEDDDYSATTAEWFHDVARLSDGSLIAVGAENYEGGGVIGSHPWVARFSADGAFLGNDRGLWDGYALDVVAGPDGSAFVLSVDSGEDGYRLRKYAP